MTLEELRRQHPGKVPVTVLSGQAFVWSPQDIRTLRVQHAICGLLVGALPQIPQQNVFLGSPLQLNPEEVTWLLRRGVIVLIADEDAHHAPSSSQAHAFHVARDDDAVRQRQEARALAAARKAEAEAKLSKMSGEAERKRREREEKRKAAAAAAAAEEDGREPEEQADDHPTATGAKEEHDDASANAAYTVHIPGPSNGPWYRPDLGDGDGVGRSSDVNAYLTLSAASRAGVWTYPRTPRERALCAVWEDLHDRGYFLGCGLRFGGDFVAYPGDPMRYHSHFTVTVLASRTAPLSALQLVAHGRLGTAVKKAHLISAVQLPGGSAGDEAANTFDEGSAEWKRRLAGGDDGPAGEPGSKPKSLGTVGGDDDAGNDWGTVTHFSLTWAGFGV